MSKGSNRFTLWKRLQWAYSVSAPQHIRLTKVNEHKFLQTSDISIETVLDQMMQQSQHLDTDNIIIFLYTV